MRGGTPCNIPGPAQGIGHLGQVQVPGDPGGIWRGSQGSLPLPQVLGEAKDGGAHGRVLQRTPLRGERRDTGVPGFSHTI